MQSDDLGLLPVAWRYRVYLHELTGEPTWSKWGVSNGPDNPGPAIGGRFEAEPLYDAAAIERLVAERDEAREHTATLLRTAQEDLVLMQETAATVTSLRERVEAAEAQLALQGEALRAIKNAARKNRPDPDAIYEMAAGALREGAQQ